MTEEMNSRLKKLLDDAKSVPARDPQAAARGRANFLRQASQIRAGVSASQERRHIWRNIFPRKEKFAMNMLITAITMFALLFGGGITVYAAQDDLPNQPLYAVKTFSEDVGLIFTSQPEARLERLLQLSQIRVNEMVMMTARGEAVPAQVEERQQQYVAEALRLAAGQGDQTMQGSLLQIREQLQKEEQTIAQLQNQAGGKNDPTLEQARLMIQERLQIAEQGLADPQTFRHAYQNSYRLGQVETPTATSTEAGTESPTQAATTSTPAGQNGSGPNATPNMGTPAPNGTNNGSGPNATPRGNGTEPNPTPGSGGGGGGNGGSGGGGAGD